MKAWRTKPSAKTANKMRLERIRSERPFEWQAQKYRSYHCIPISASQLEGLWNAQGGRCALTGRTLDIHSAQLDHKHPLSRGGSAELSNLRWLCKEANYAKHNLTDEEFFRLCSDVGEFIGRAALAYLGLCSAA